jgi:hypothetical protein
MGSLDPGFWNGGGKEPKLIGAGSANQPKQQHYGRTCALPRQPKSSSRAADMDVQDL